MLSVKRTYPQTNAMTPIMLPIFNLKTDAIALELIDAVRIATDDRFRLTLHGPIR